MALLEQYGGGDVRLGVHGGDDDGVLGSRRDWLVKAGLRVLESQLRGRGGDDDGAEGAQHGGDDDGDVAAQPLRVWLYERRECSSHQRPSLLLIFSQSSCRL